MSSLWGGRKEKKIRYNVNSCKIYIIYIQIYKPLTILVFVNYRIKEISPRDAKFRFGELDRKREKRREKWRRLRSITKNAVADRVPYIFMGTVYGFYSLHINYIVKDSPGAAR